MDECHILENNHKEDISRHMIKTSHFHNFLSTSYTDMDFQAFNTSESPVFTEK